MPSKIWPLKFAYFYLLLCFITHLPHFDSEELIGFPKPSWLFDIFLFLIVPVPPTGIPPSPPLWMLRSSTFIASPPTFVQMSVPPNFTFLYAISEIQTNFTACITMIDLHNCLHHLTLTFLNARVVSYSFVSSKSCTVWHLITPNKCLVNEWMGKFRTWRPCFKKALINRWSRIS